MADQSTEHLVHHGTGSGREPGTQVPPPEQRRHAREAKQEPSSRWLSSRRSAVDCPSPCPHEPSLCGFPFLNSSFCPLQNPVAVIVSSQRERMGTPLPSLSFNADFVWCFLAFTFQRKPNNSTHFPCPCHSQADLSSPPPSPAEQHASARCAWRYQQPTATRNICVSA